MYGGAAKTVKGRMKYGYAVITNPGRPIFIPLRITHPNVTISVYQQTREIGVQPENEYSKVIQGNQLDNRNLKVNAYRCRYGIHHPRNGIIQDGPTTLKKDWCWITQPFSTRRIITLSATCPSLTENASISNTMRKVNNF